MPGKKKIDESSGWCRYNPGGVLCGDHSQCERCGWNPDVAWVRAGRVRWELEGKPRKKGIKLC